jgi:hypothetical protein
MVTLSALASAAPLPTRDALLATLLGRVTCLHVMTVEYVRVGGCELVAVNAKTKATLQQRDYRYLHRITISPWKTWFTAKDTPPEF